MESTIFENTYPFLWGGGEMGALTRQYDWSKTSIGSPDQWPYSLRTTVSNLLRSKFPKFLWWGKDMIQFYNDAYRPSLGHQGKHPTALGQKGPECWPEIWDIISPLHEQVETTGEATWMEDQLVPIYRNGKMEDVYWTFSYSSVLDDEGKHGGILVTCTETTEKVANLKKLSESEQALRFAIEAAELGTWDYDPATNLFSGNERLKEWFGLALTEHVSLTDAVNAIAEKDQKRVTDAIQVALQFESGGFYDIEYTIINSRNKQERVVRAKGRAWFNNNKICYRFNGTLQDVSEQVFVRERLKESTQQIRSLIESAPFPIAVYEGREMRIVFANQAIVNVWGKGDQWIGNTYYGLLPELESQQIYPLLDGVFTTGIPFHARNQQVDLVMNGELTPFYFNYSFTPLFDVTGKVYGVMNTAADVTDLVEAKQKIEQNERSLHNMILQAPVAMCILTGPDHVIEVANQLIIELWGKPAADVMNKPVFEALPDARQQGLEELLENVYCTGVSFRANERPVSLLRNGKYETVYQDFVYEPYRDNSGTILGIIAITIDVTQQVIVRQETEQLYNKIAELNAKKDEFIGLASHELKTPLTSINAYLQIVERLEMDVNAKKFVERTLQQVKKLNGLVSDLLDVSKIEAGKLQLTPQPFDIRTIIDDTIELIGHSTNDHTIVLQTDVKHFTVCADALRIEQVLVNLLSNAIKYSPGAEKVEVLLSRMPDGVKVGIRDFGQGIPLDKLTQIFSRFYRIEDANPNISGLGIGLYLSHEIITRHNGQLWAESEVSKGSIFWFTLPA